MKPPIYLDYNATTPLAPEVREAMLPFLESGFGNPSSAHWYGRQAKAALEKAREQVAALIGASPDEITFTSGGSEANNLALKGVLTGKDSVSHLITSKIEHPAINDVCAYLEKQGLRTTRVDVDPLGILNLSELEQALQSDTRLVSVMHSNNEIGSIQPLSEISNLTRPRGVLLHSDAAQSTGKTPLNVNQLGVDLLSIASHKLYGPKGIGALYVRRGVQIEKQIHGADHERNLRAGTENVLQAVGFGAACELALRTLDKRISHSKQLRDLLWTLIAAELPQAYFNGHPEQRLSNTLSITFPGIDAQTLLAELDTIAASAGAACHADDIHISPTLAAIGLSEQDALSTLRFSTGDMLSEEQLREAASQIIAAAKRLGGLQERTAGLHPSQEIRLTRYTHGLGCACKLRPQALEKVLQELILPCAPEQALLGFEFADDAAAYQINESECIVQSVDFFTPIVDRPYDFGAIAAANALSDLYAMGAKALFALNIVGFPTNRLPLSVLSEILQGASDKCREAGVAILGGHSVEDSEPKFGMSVTGICNPNGLWKNQGAQPGDLLILTKPIGTGILTTAMKQQECSAEESKLAISIMSELNMRAAQVATEFDIHSCTDITGFGLLGHLREMLIASKMSAELAFADIPIIEAARAFAARGIIPGGSRNNLEHVQNDVDFASHISSTERLILADAQTSGGLLFAVAENESKAFLDELTAACSFGAWQIGKIKDPDKFLISIV